MSHVLDARASDLTLRLSTGVDHEITVAITDHGEPLEGVTPAVLLGGPMDAVEPITGETAPEDTYTGTGGDDGVWTVAVAGQSVPGNHRLRVTLDGTVVAVGLAVVGSDGARSTSSTLSIAGGSVTLSLSVAAVVNTGGGGTTDTVARAAIAEHVEDTTNPHEVTAAQVGAAPTVHTHPTSAVTGLDAALAGKAPTVHSHAEGDVTGLTAALAGKAATVHGHAQSDVTGLTGALAAKANTADLGTAAAQPATAFATAAQGALAATAVQPGDLATPDRPGTWAVRRHPDLVALDPLLAAATAAAPLDVVTIGDSQAAISSPDGANNVPWPVRLARVLGGDPTADFRVAKDPGGLYVGVRAMSSNGTASTAGIAKCASSLAVGQFCSVPVDCTHARIWWTGGGGSIQVRDGSVGGTLVTTIDTSAASGTARYTDLSVAAGTLPDAGDGRAVGTLFFVAASSTTVVEALAVWSGSVRLLNPSRTGVTSAEAQEAAMVQTATTQTNPDLVIVATGTNDDGDLADDLPDLLAASASSAPSAAVAVLCPPLTDVDGVGVTFSKADAAIVETAAGTADAPLMSLTEALDSNWLTDPLTADGIHYSPAGHEWVARLVHGLVTGDPLGVADTVGRTDLGGYTPGPATRWAGSAPSTIAEGLDELAHTDPVAVTVTASTVLPVAPLLHVSSAAIVDVTATPQISDGAYDGQAMRIVNVGSYPINFAGETAGGTFVGTAGTNLRDRVTLAPTEAATLQWSAGDGRWWAVSHESQRLVATGGTLALYSALDRRYAEITFGSFFGIVHLGMGPGGTSGADAYFARSAAGVMSIGTTVLSGADGVIAAGHRQVVNAQTGTAYTVANADVSKTIVRNNAGASTQTWPQDSAATSLAVGTIIRTYNRGAGAVTHGAGAGATVLGGGVQPTGTWWEAQKVSANTWAVGSVATADHTHTPAALGVIAAAGDAVTLWLGTETEYAAIGSPSATTVYVVSEDP